jgi:HPr kinase/phosphorylase
MNLNNLKEIRKKNITVGFLFESCKQNFHLTPLNGNVAFNNIIADKNINRPGLALAGYVELFTYDRVQIFGNTEIRYLNNLSYEDRIKACKTIFQFQIPCIVITNNNVIDQEIIDIAKRSGIPMFHSPISTTKFIYFLSDFLDDQFAPQTAVHGAFIDVYGIGILITGRSGIGKSEIALDLVERGHRLVADDVVIITRKGEGILIGSGNELVQHYMEIRGLGLIDVRNIFGIRAIRFQKRVEVLVELEEWQKNIEYTRTGLDESMISVLGVEIPHVKLPIFPGKNVTVITEVIALNYLLKHYGVDAPKEFSKRLSMAIQDKEKEQGISKRIIDYFEHDFE